MDKISVLSKEAKIGTVWDEKGNDRVAGIYVWYDQYKVKALQFLFYDCGGRIFKSKVRGMTMNETAVSFAAVLFDRPSEYLTSISGSHKKSYRLDYLLSTLKFGTNKGVTVEASYAKVVHTGRLRGHFLRKEIENKLGQRRFALRAFLRHLCPASSTVIGDHMREANKNIMRLETRLQMPRDEQQALIV
ncbi:hypothetical protein CQW23_22528 [Capsicum baccatum]|uniref:Jacalin-type lectin domain-containing protein n=1 Tax=Capsicum baccatum TaxID=33114 RepID=A0A2G2W153_CAPBA|nr:hypothetical protein CQW23_22528 [Capsicum baccatum]